MKKKKKKKNDLFFFLHDREEKKKKKRPITFSQIRKKKKKKKNDRFHPMFFWPFFNFSKTLVISFLIVGQRDLLLGKYRKYSKVCDTKSGEVTSLRLHFFISHWEEPADPFRHGTEVRPLKVGERVLYVVHLTPTVLRNTTTQQRDSVCGKRQRIKQLQEKGEGTTK